MREEINKREHKKIKNKEKITEKKLKQLLKE